MEASQFSYSPSATEVNHGDTVTISLTSTDAVHGLYVDGYGVSVQADPGQTASLTFVAKRPGSFRFRCNVTCGALHPFMIGKLTVGQRCAALPQPGPRARSARSGSCSHWTSGPTLGCSYEAASS